ncbi:MAG: AraC family transcriptional regulator [Pseudolabrys sp.]|nr:AraC family transcriptional regulator [Pseudolabrys sp.]
MTRQACARIAAVGVDPAPLLAQAGLTMEQIENPDSRFRAQSQIKFLQLAADALGDDLLGFHLARHSELREVGLLYYVLASSSTLGDSLQRAERYSALNNEGISLRLRDEPATLIAFQYVGIERKSDRHQIEYLLTFLIRICRQLTNSDLRPRRVRMVHRHSAAATELNAFIGCDMEFGSEVDEVEFSGNVGIMPVVSGDPYLNSLLIKYCEEALADHAAAHGALRRDVENAIAVLLPHGKAQLGEVAVQLGMSRRTLARRLASQGLSFAGVLAQLRVDLAKRELRDASLTISQVAWLLGYREVSAFTHAFKRWTGKTPREVRAAA